MLLHVGLARLVPIPPTLSPNAFANAFVLSVLTNLGIRLSVFTTLSVLTTLH